MPWFLWLPPLFFDPSFPLFPIVWPPMPSWFL